MERLRKQIVPILALILVGVAALTARWVSQMDPDPRAATRTGFARQEAHNHAFMYRFLIPQQRGAVVGRLTLGRFAGGELQERVWELSGVEQWHGSAPSIFDREAGWVAGDQPGYRISGWLCAEGPATSDRDHLFWTLQALRFLDLESLANEIDMIESSGRTVQICLTQGASDYDYDSDTLYWNPVATRYLPADRRLDRKWFETDPLITLAHQLHHAWHDVCCEGDLADAEAREPPAVMAENRIRHILFLKDPTRSDIYPRPGCQETCPDTPGDSAQEAWWNYPGRVRIRTLLSEAW